MVSLRRNPRRANTVEVVDESKKRETYADNTVVDIEDGVTAERIISDQSGRIGQHKSRATAWVELKLTYWLNLIPGLQCMICSSLQSATFP